MIKMLVFCQNNQTVNFAAKDNLSRQQVDD